MAGRQQVLYSHGAESRHRLSFHSTGTFSFENPPIAKPTKINTQRRARRFFTLCFKYTHVMLNDVCNVFFLLPIGDTAGGIPRSGIWSTLEER